MDDRHPGSHKRPGFLERLASWRARPLLLFLLLLLLFPAAASVARWWRGETLAWLEWAGVVAFPALLWLWWRHFSVMGCQPCQTSAERQAHPPDRPDA